MLQGGHRQGSKLKLPLALVDYQPAGKNRRRHEASNVRTNLRLFTREFVNHIVDSLQDAISNPEWRATAIEDARDGWAQLNRRLARDDVPQGLQAINARLALLFEFEGFPTCEAFDPARIEENERVEAKLRELIKGIDGIFPPDR
jgi:hypothetical protein